jgi:chromosome segregation ATPase
MMRARAAALSALVVVIAVLCTSPAVAARNNGRNAAAVRQAMINSLQQQLGQARQVLSAAQAEISQAQGQIDESKSRVESAKSTLESVKTDKRNSRQVLDQLEADLIEKAGPDSDIGKAHAELLAAEDAHATAKKNVLNSSEYKDKIAAIEPDQRTKQLPIVQKDALKEDYDFQHARGRLKLAQAQWGQQRTAMLQANEDWMAASKAMRGSQAEEHKVDGEARAGAMARMPAAARMRDAQQVASDAMETIGACEYQLRQLGVNPTPPAKTTAKR